MDTDQSYDVVIVGGGAAGLSAATTLGRSRRSVAVVDSGAPRNAPAAGVHNFLSRDGFSPTALLTEGRAEVARYGGEIIEGEAVSASGKIDEFDVTLSDGRTLSARRLVVTSGLTDVLPDIPGIRERWGHDVLHCPYCHGWEVRDQPIAVLSTSTMTGHHALMFRQLSDQVTILSHTGPPLGDEEAGQLAARSVPVVDGEVVALEVADDALTGVRLADGQVIACQALVVRPLFIAHSPVLEALGLQATESPDGDRSYPTGEAGSTEIPGVWAAGNVTDPMAWVMAAAAAGTMTGAFLNVDLIHSE